MKIAIFHNYIDNIGGAEKVSLTMARELKADFYTTNIDKDKVRKMGFGDINLISIGKVSINAPFRQQLASLRFRHLNLKNKYDFYIIAGDWAMSGAVNNKPNLWYVYSPIREIWDLNKYVRENIVLPWKRPIFDIWTAYNRHLNKKYIKHVDKIAAISEHVQKRIKRYLNRDSFVAHAPINVSDFYFKEYGNFWLSVNRLTHHKRVDIQVRAFEQLPNENLIIVGSYEQSRHFKGYADYIKRIKPNNVEILSWVEQDKLKELYATCKGVITTSKDEDYGLSPLEAGASGKPAIASNEGGHKEIMIQGKTGILIDNINEDKLVQAIKEIGKNPEKYKKACLAQAQNFDTKIFINKIKDIIET